MGSSMPVRRTCLRPLVRSRTIWPSGWLEPWPDKRVRALHYLEIREREARDAKDWRHAIGSRDLVHLGVRRELDAAALERSLGSDIE